jgi:peptidoglycan lytic transglycosylase
MDIRHTYRSKSIKTPIGICILAGAVTGTLVAMITSVSTPTVQADVELSRAVETAPASSPATPPTTAIPAAKNDAQKPASKHRFGVIHGIASWYGGAFNGRKTASGEKYDENAMTACQPNLPFGSIVRVVNRSNKRSVVVRINDRGNLIYPDRVIDLSRAAADKLAMTYDGIAKVDVEVLSLGGPHSGS